MAAEEPREHASLGRRIRHEGAIGGRRQRGGEYLLGNWEAQGRKHGDAPVLDLHLAVKADLALGHTVLRAVAQRVEEAERTRDARQRLGVVERGHGRRLLDNSSLSLHLDHRCTHGEGGGRDGSDRKHDYLRVQAPERLLIRCRTDVAQVSRGMLSTRRRWLRRRYVAHRRAHRFVEKDQEVAQNIPQGVRKLQQQQQGNYPNRKSSRND